VLRYEGIGGFLLLVADVWAIINIVESREPTGRKVFWAILVLVLPLVGFLFWLGMGPRSAKA
jgi:hypothetical protein